MDINVSHTSDGYALIRDHDYKAMDERITALEAENKALREALKLAQRYLTHPDVLAITKSMAVRGEVVNERIANLLEG
jgi:cell shape-determining protein MreC